MNEAQTLLEIENFMLKATKRRYRWNDFEAEFDELKRKASTVYHSGYEYSPLIQSYFDLLPENISWEDQDIFEHKRVFQCFQRELAEKHENFLDNLNEQIRDNQKSLKNYFNELLDRHRKLLLVRVDLSYSALAQPSISRFNRDVERVVSRIQDKDTIFNRDSYLAQCIGELWKDKITGGCGQFYNCNQAKHKKYYLDLNQLGIGMIERRNSKDVGNALKAISYLADLDKDDQYLRAHLKGMRKFSKGGSMHRNRDSKKS